MRIPTGACTPNCSIHYSHWTWHSPDKLKLVLGAVPYVSATHTTCQPLISNQFIERIAQCGYFVYVLSRLHYTNWTLWAGAQTYMFALCMLFGFRNCVMLDDTNYNRNAFQRADMWYNIHRTSLFAWPEMPCNVFWYCCLAVLLADDCVALAWGLSVVG